eukprot:27191_1
MMMDVDEYIIPKSGYQHLTLMDLIRMTRNNATEEPLVARERSKKDILQAHLVRHKKKKYERHKSYFKNIAMELYCYKLFTCKEDWGCIHAQTNRKKRINVTIRKRDGFESVLERQRRMSYER